MILQSKYLRFSLLLLVLATFVAGCRDEPSDVFAPSPTDTPAVAAAPTNIPASSASPTAAPTESPTRIPTATPLPEPQIVLPAPLYFLVNGQIQRLETDGITLTQLTQESKPITDFDVSPIDARLVYVTDNTLIEANPQYGTLIVKVTGEALDPNNPADAITQRIANPYFSPDGSRIAFGLNGVNLVLAGEDDEATLLLPSDPYPDLNNPPRSNVRFFSPRSWSLDGELLLVEFSYWPEAGGLAILDPSSGALTEMNNQDPNAPICCEWAWSRDGAAGYIASNLLGYGTPGLSQVDVATGLVSLILPGMPTGDVSAESPLRLFRGPHQTNDGALLAFVSEQATMQDSVGYVMAEIENAEAESTQANEDALSPLRADPFESNGDLLWARDGSGAAVVLVTEPGPLGFAGPILWLPVDGSPSTELPAFGEKLRWGPSATTPALSTRTDEDETDQPDDESESTDTAATGTATFTAQVLLNVRSGPSTAFPIIGDLAADESTRITGVSPDGDWWQIIYPIDGDGRAWVIGDPEFGEAEDTDDVAVVTPPPLPRSVGRIFYSAPGVDGVSSVFAHSLAPGASAELMLADASQPALSPGGGRLAVRSTRSDLLGLGVFDLTSEQILGITSHAEDSLANWAPNAGRLVFASTRHGDRRWRVYVGPADGSQTAQEVNFGLDPDWHPTADVIVYKGCNERGEACGLWTMTSGGGNQRALTENVTDARPVWSPDGRTIVFMSESRHGNWEVYSLNAGNGVVTRLTEDASLDGLPTVSPDSSRVAFVSNRGGSWGIWVAPISGGAAQRVIEIGVDLPNWLEQGIDWAE
ncbi:SH3 domain-containing protein [bacterium]|nr:SH3 domain-containing protein [bacterium]